VQALDSLSRRKFIALAGGSVAAGAVLAACGSDSEAAGETSRFGEGDVGILNYTLTLEYVELALYTSLLKSGLFVRKARKALATFGEEEEEHISSLTEAVEKLEGEPARKPKTRFTMTSAKPALEVASTVENLVAAAYLGQVPMIESHPALATVLSIHTVEGRHAAAIDTALGLPITPDGAFAKPATAMAVLKALGPYAAV
jgi:hypothetical protein